MQWSKDFGLLWSLSIDPIWHKHFVPFWIKSENDKVSIIMNRNCINQIGRLYYQSDDKQFMTMQKEIFFPLSASLKRKLLRENISVWSVGDERGAGRRQNLRPALPPNFFKLNHWQERSRLLWKLWRVCIQTLLPDKQSDKNCTRSNVALDINNGIFLDMLVTSTLYSCPWVTVS